MMSEEKLIDLDILKSDIEHGHTTDFSQDIYFENKRFKAPILARDLVYDIFDENTQNAIIGPYLVTKDNKQIWVYNGIGYFTPDGEAIIRSKVQELLGANCRDVYKNEVVSWVKDCKDLWIDREQFDNKKFLNLKNGILNLKTFEFIEHDKTYYFNNQIPVNYDPKAKCPKIMKFLEELLPLDYVKILQEFFGDCLNDDYRNKIAIMCAGPKNTGKSTLLTLLGKFFGEENIANVSLHDLCQDRFATIELYRKKVNVSSDIGSQSIRHANMFLMLTGGDLVRAQKKFQDPFNFRNTAKLAFSCNTIPESENKNPAYYVRWIVIPFENVFEGEDRNRAILDELCTSEEFSGLLNWAIKGLKRLMKNNGYSEHMSLEETKAFMEQGKNPAWEFITTFVEKDTGNVSKEYVYNCYRRFCELNNYPVLANNAFSRKFKQYGPYSLTEGQSSKPKHMRVWKGVRCNYELPNEQGVK